MSISCPTGFYLLIFFSLSVLSDVLTRYVSHLTGRPESTFINYRAGEGMPELVRLRKIYEFTVRNSSAGSGPTVEIRIPAEFATTANRQVTTQCFFLKSCNLIFKILNSQVNWCVGILILNLVVLYMNVNVKALITFWSIIIFSNLRFDLYTCQIRGSQLWGTDIYTDDSDIVAGIN